MAWRRLAETVQRCGWVSDILERWNQVNLLMFEVGKRGLKDDSQVWMWCVVVTFTETGRGAGCWGEGIES